MVSLKLHTFASFWLKFVIVCDWDIIVILASWAIIVLNMNTLGKLLSEEPDVSPGKTEGKQGKLFANFFLIETYKS